MQLEKRIDGLETAFQQLHNKCLINLVPHWPALHHTHKKKLHLHALGDHSIHKADIGKKIKLRLNQENKDFLTVYTIKLTLD